MQINGVSNFQSRINFTSHVFMNSEFLKYARQNPSDKDAWNEVINAMRHNGDKYVVNISKSKSHLSDENESTGAEQKDIFQVSIYDPELNQTKNIIKTSDNGIFDPLALKTIYGQEDEYFHNQKTHLTWV